MLKLFAYAAVLAGCAQVVKGLSMPAGEMMEAHTGFGASGIWLMSFGFMALSRVKWKRAAENADTDVLILERQLAETKQENLILKAVREVTR